LQSYSPLFYILCQAPPLYTPLTKRRFRDLIEKKQ
jgi:hypothetical protein